MYSFLEKLDLFIIDRLERMFQAFQKWTGIDNFICTYIVCVLMVICGLLQNPKIPNSSQIQVKILGCVLLLYFVFRINKIRHRVYEDLLNGHKNYLVEANLVDRLVTAIIFLFLIFIISFSVHILDYYSIAYICFSYMQSCTPLPPGQSKAKQFLVNLKYKVVPQEG